MSGFLHIIIKPRATVFAIAFSELVSTRTAQGRMHLRRPGGNVFECMRGPTLLLHHNSEATHCNRLAPKRPSLAGNCRSRTTHRLAAIPLRATPLLHRQRIVLFDDIVEYFHQYSGVNRKLQVAEQTAWMGGGVAYERRSYATPPPIQADCSVSTLVHKAA